MALGPRLDIKQSQQLLMTPQLQQAIKLLALSNLDLQSYINEALDRNPLLESMEGTRADDSQSAGSYEGEAVVDDLPSSGAQASDSIMSSGPKESESPLNLGDHADPEWVNEPLDRSLSMNDTPVAGGGYESDGFDIDNILVAEKSLSTHLLEQAGQRWSDTDLFIARQIIDQIDEAGYYRGDLSATASQLSVPVARMEALLAGIQQFDPSGIGARSLSECLIIQAREADRYDPIMAKLIDNLDLLGSGAFAQIMRLCRIDQEDLNDMIAELRNYDPKPGLRFDTVAVQTVVPDIFVKETKKGWAIEINSATLPRLLIDRRYYAELHDGAHDKKSRTWLKECMADANWLVKALDQRQKTIIKVASEILKQQSGFFTHGVSHLRPLTLRQVAEAINMHESTVSRVTSNKYLSCDRGLFELKYFFASGIQSNEGGSAVSATAVKDRIKALIEAEEIKKILSDDKLVALLKEEGFDIARRTVAKYREALGLGSSVERRRQKKMMAGRAA